MLKLLNNSIMISASVFALGCVQDFDSTEMLTSEPKAKVVLSNYGHLEDVHHYKANSMYLSNLPKEEVYKICLNERLIKKYPGIKAEVEASVNIWAHYIERKIKTEIIVKNLPFPGKDWEVKDFHNAYKSSCGNDTDLYLSEDYPSGRRLGYTGKSLSYYRSYNGGRHQISKFTRVLNLTAWPSDSKRKFISLEKATNKKYSAEEIFKILVNRNKTIYLPEDETYLTLTTLVHEFGHVWGLCDQYPLEGNKTNCDPLHSTLSPHGHIILEEDAIMSSAGWINKLGLHDDDIIGLIDLAQRTDVVKTGWPSPGKTLSDFPEQRDIEKKVKFLHTNDATVNSAGELEVNSALHIEGEFGLIIQMKLKGQEAWRERGPVFSFHSGAKTRNMKLRYRGYNTSEIESVRLVFTKNGESSQITEEMLNSGNISNEVKVSRH